MLKKLLSTMRLISEITAPRKAAVNYELIETIRFSNTIVRSIVFGRLLLYSYSFLILVQDYTCNITINYSLLSWLNS